MPNPDRAILPQGSESRWFSTRMQGTPMHILVYSNIQLANFITFSVKRRLCSILLGDGQ